MKKTELSKSIEKLVDRESLTPTKKLNCEKPLKLLLRQRKDERCLNVNVTKVEKKKKIV